MNAIYYASVKNLAAKGTMVLIGLLAAACCAGCSSQHAAATQDNPNTNLRRLPQIKAIVPAERHPFTSRLQLVGTLIPWNITTISAEVDGKIAYIAASDEVIKVDVNDKHYEHQLLLDIGHEVYKGQLLAKIDPTDYELQLRIAQAKLELAQKQLEKLLAWERDEKIRQLQAQLEEAQAELERATRDYARYSVLYEKGVVSQSEFDAVLTRKRAAEARVEQLNAALEMSQKPTPEEIAVAKAQVKLAEAEVAVWQEKLSKCEIRCPLDRAVIVDRFVGIGDRVTSMPATPIMRLVDPTVLFAEVGVPQRYQGRIRVNDLAEVSVKGLAQKVPGVICLIDEKVDPETRCFRVRVAIDNADRLVKSGSFAEVTLTVKTAPDSVAVPKEAISYLEGVPVVFVFHPKEKNTGSVELRAVELGVSNEQYHEVIRGLQAGELVALGDGERLQDGMLVELAQKTDKLAGQAKGSTAP